MSNRILLSIAVAVAAVVAASWVILPNSNALSNLEDRCVASTSGQAPSPPCVKVDRADGYVVLKDRKGSAHDLLLPIEKITGIESRTLLGERTPNYFELAWDNRTLLPGYAAGVSDHDILLAINSWSGRSQNQMHIHISCIKAVARSRLDTVNSSITQIWEPIVGGLAGHEYWARRAGMNEFSKVGAFRLLASGLPNAASDMAKFSMAMTVSQDGDVVLLATERNLFDFNLASAEELQDQDCKEHANDGGGA